MTGDSTILLPQGVDYVAEAFILKPVGMSRGRGITLVTKIEDIVYSDACVIQDYIARPLLVDGYKCDLRLYVVVTQFSPLEAFISRRGFARMASVKYCSDVEATADQRYMHLTNTAVSDEAKLAGVHNASMQEATKWPLERLEAYINRQWRSDPGRASLPNEDRWTATWQRICDVVMRTLTAVEDHIPCCPCSFELFGFDVLLDEHLRPWVLEVNASPSMEVSTPLDEATKPALIRDIIRLVDPVPCHRCRMLAALAEVTSGLKAHEFGGSNKAKKPPEPLQGRRAAPATGVAAASTPPSDERDPPPTGDETVLRHWIFGHRWIRAYGDLPDHMGQFERIAPSAAYQLAVKQKRAAR